MIAYIEFSQQLIVSRIKPDIHLTHCKPLYSWRNSITPSRVGLMWMLSLAMVYLLSWVKHFPIILFMVEGEKKKMTFTQEKLHFRFQSSEQKIMLFSRNYTTAALGVSFIIYSVHHVPKCKSKIVCFISSLSYSVPFTSFQCIFKFLFIQEICNFEKLRIHFKCIVITFNML